MDLISGLIFIFFMFLVFRRIHRWWVRSSEKYEAEEHARQEALKLSPEELSELSSIAQDLGLPSEGYEATRTILEYFRRLHKATQDCSEGLPIIECSLSLKKDEVCHYVGECSWKEFRKERSRINYGGPTARIKIMKGIYWRMGSLATGGNYEDVLRTIDTGDLYITNKRIIFNGNHRNTTITKGRILKISPGTDGFTVEKTTGPDVLFYTDDPLAALIAAEI